MIDAVNMYKEQQSAFCSILYIFCEDNLDG